MTLLLGDCLELMPTLPAGSVDMVLCDLPYGTTCNKWDSVLSMPKLWAAWKRLCRPGGPIVLFSQQPFTTTLVASNLRHFRYEWIWEKPLPSGFLNAKVAPLKAHENILIFCDKGPPYHPQMAKKTPSRPGVIANLAASGHESDNYGRYLVENDWKDTGVRYPRSVIYESAERYTAIGKKGNHPTEKPVALCEYLIRTYTRPGAVVFDNCMGSGSTLVAAARCGRQGIGIEQHEPYFRIAELRVAAELAQKGGAA